MVIRKKALCCFATLFMVIIFPSLALCQAPRVDKSTIVNHLASQMALKEQLEQPPSTIKEQFKQNPLQLSQKANRQMLRKFDNAFASEKLLNDFKQSLKNKITNQRAEEVSQWLRTHHTRSVLAAKKDYYSLQGKRKRVIRMYKMDKTPPSEQRKKLIEAYVNATDAAQSSVNSSVIILQSVIKALSKISKDRSFSDSQIQAIVSNFKAQLQPTVAEQINKQMLVTFYDVKENNLQHYVHYLQQGTGKWLSGAINQSMRAAYKKAADRFLQSVHKV